MIKLDDYHEQWEGQFVSPLVGMDFARIRPVKTFDGIPLFSQKYAEYAFALYPRAEFLSIGNDEMTVLIHRYNFSSV